MAVQGETSRAMELTDAVRRLNLAVIDHLIPDARAEELLADIDRLCRSIDGPHRARYYELEPSAGDQERHTVFANYSPVSGRLHPLALPLEVTHVVDPDGTKAVEGRARIGSLFEGPPHSLHGGFVASLFDELLGHAVYGHRLPALTAQLTIRYRALTPLNQDLVLHGHLKHERGRRWIARATCQAGETLTAEAEGLFMAVDLEAVGFSARPAPGAD